MGATNAANITLYSFFDGDRSNRIRWCLEELGLEYSEHKVDWRKKEHRSKGFLSISPLAKIPGLRIGKKTFFDSGAACVNLADMYPESGLAPDPGALDRATFMEWCFTAVTTIESVTSPLFSGHKFHHQIEDKARQFAVGQFESFGQLLERRLSENGYLLSRGFTVADILMATSLGYGMRSNLYSPYLEIQKYLDRVGNRPAAGRAKVVFGTPGR